MKVSILLIIIFIYSQLYSQSDFLLINNSAERAGKGDAGVASYSDISSSLLNPASSVKNQYPQLSFSYLIYDNNMNYNYLGIGFPLYSNVISFHLIYLTLPNTSEVLGGENTGDYLNYNDLAFIVSDSIKIKHYFNLGINVKFIKREISDISAKTVAFDMGVIKDFSLISMQKSHYNNASIGISINNIGGKIKFIDQEETLPLSVTFGMKYSTFRKLTFVYDINRTEQNGFANYFGAEYETPFYLVPRIGLKLEEETIFMTGLGVNYQLNYLRIKCDYANNLIGQSVKEHVFSLNLEIRPLKKYTDKRSNPDIVIKKTNTIIKHFITNVNYKRIKRVAVLDFKNTSQNDDLEYLSVAIPESIATYLGNNENIKVIDRNAVNSRLSKLSVKLNDFQNEHELKLLGKILNVDKLITGSYVSVNRKLRINTHLIDIESGEILVADQIQGEEDKEIFLLFDKTAIYLLNKINAINKERDPNNNSGSVNTNTGIIPER